MRNDFLLEKAYKFALRIVKLCRYLTEEQKEFVLSKKILDAGTGIGSQLEQASQAESSADFLHHFTNANKKSFETNFWLRLLRDSSFITEKQALSLLEDCDELQRLLTTSVKTAKSKTSAQK